jgi:protein-tyrosine phosphatase
MFKKLFSKSKERAQLPFVDIHSHLLPGIDDGAPTMEHSLAMIQRFADLGYKKLITTPHIKQGVFDNTKEIILEKCEEVKLALRESNLSIELECSAEYFYDDHFLELIRTNQLLPFHGNHILFECTFHNPPNQLEELVFTLKSKGFQPILAHFERYRYFHGSVSVARDLRERGCLIQTNWNSFSEHYGPEVRKQALLLQKENLIDIYGSDCHRIEHLQLFERLQTDKYVQKLLNSTLQNNAFI